MTLKTIIKIAGGQSAVAAVCGVSSNAVFKWTRRGLPRSEWSRETNYAAEICKLANKALGKRVYTRAQLLEISKELRKSTGVNR